jgi:type IV pilus assembly protein PilA
MLRGLKRAQRGQGMTEYIIIVALIAIAAIAVYQFFGATVRNQTAAIANELAGESTAATTARTAAATSAGSAATQANRERNLNNYVGNATAAP